VTSLPKALFCTAAGGRYGIGHLRRCLSLIEAGKSWFESYLYIMKGDNRYPEVSSRYRTVTNLNDIPAIDLIVSDMRDTKLHEMRRLERIAPIVSIDDKGAARGRAPVCIYSLPQREVIQGNYLGPSFIVLDTRIQDCTPLSFGEKQGITVSFGGSDPENLTEYVTRLLNEVGVYPTIVKGPLYRHDTSMLKGEIVEGGDDIFDLINRSKVLITSFGITMYEAFYLKTPVILFNRTKYHYELGCKTSAVNLGFKGKRTQKELAGELEREIKMESMLAESAERNSSVVDGMGALRVAAIIKRALDAVRRDCLLSHKRYRVMRRSEDFSIIQCRRCRDIFLYELKDRGAVYDDPDYFFDDYKRRYGKSYIDDRDNIVKLGDDRIRTIQEIKGGKGRLLDVGCAMGFFLDLAKGRGWEVQGVEVSAYAAGWAREKLELDVINADFLDVEIEPASFDAVCFFFVAEHFKNIEDVVEKAYVILKKGGIICMALPNRGGVSFRFNRQLYLDQRPRDHYFDTNSKNLNRFLETYGFKCARIRVTGIHPERFFKRFFPEKTNGDTSIPLWVEKMYSGLARKVSLGDTFEYYAIKE
jgi:spore coat polysaccharide biosynthesis predicted glycosyltransferase SpsG/SAM-dependent methyltransferase